MRVLVVTNMYPSERQPLSGIFVAEYVSSIQRAGVEVDVFHTDVGPSKSEYVRRIPALRRQLREGYDVVHAQHTYCVYQVRTAAPVGRARPLLLTCHEGEALLSGEVANPEARGFKRVVYSPGPKRVAMNLSDWVVSVHADVPRRVGYRRAFDVIPPGVDTRLFRPLDMAECRQKLGWEADEQVVLFPASPARSFIKGFDLLTAALDRMGDRARLVTGGSISHDDMPLFMNAADVVAQTSRFEASPQVIKEAMACNRPIVTTGTGDTASLIDGVDGAFLVDHDVDTIASALATALDRGRPTNGRDRIDSLELTLEAAAAKYLGIYERLTADRLTGSRRRG